MAAWSRVQTLVDFHEELWSRLRAAQLDLVDEIRKVRGLTDPMRNGVLGNERDPNEDD
jgi:hypothetical protein